LTHKEKQDVDARPKAGHDEIKMHAVIAGLDPARA
jgi:hypothetical protein